MNTRKSNDETAPIKGLSLTIPGKPPPLPRVPDWYPILWLIILDTQSPFSYTRRTQKRIIIKDFAEKQRTPMPGTGTTKDENHPLPSLPRRRGGVQGGGIF